MTEAEMAEAERVMPLLPRTKDGKAVIPLVDRVYRILGNGTIVKRIATVNLSSGDYSSLAAAKFAGGQERNGR